MVLLGGSWYYLLAGVGFVVVGVLLWMRRPVALLLYALPPIATLIWALWEAGLDWWPLATRLGVPVLLGAWLLLPWVRRGLDGRRSAVAGHRSAPRRSWIPLAAAVAAAVLLSVGSWWNDPHRIEGTAPGPRGGTDVVAEEVPADEWHAYGRTGYGQRYSPLTQITPANVAELEVAWTYRTGDFRGQPGDPVETTFEVTPLKVGNRLFLCTPHQFVTALDATTGEELWLDPKIQDRLSLQHLTCRGLSYYPGPGAMAEDAVADVMNRTGKSDEPARRWMTRSPTPAGQPPRRTPSGAPVAVTTCRSPTAAPHSCSCRPRTDA